LASPTFRFQGEPWPPEPKFSLAPVPETINPRPRLTLIPSLTLSLSLTLTLSLTLSLTLKTSSAQRRSSRPPVPGWVPPASPFNSVRG
jgi:hypothetical protein